MKRILKSLIIFYDNKSVLIQDRKTIKKPGKPYGFFGGSIEEGETSEQAIVREIEEELSINLGKFSLFKKLEENNEEMHATWHLFIAPMPNLSEINVKEGEPYLASFEKVLSLDLSDRDKNMLKMLFKHLGI